MQCLRALQHCVCACYVLAPPSNARADRGLAQQFPDLLDPSFDEDCSLLHRRASDDISDGRPGSARGSRRSYHRSGLRRTVSGGGPLARRSAGGSSAGSGAATGRLHTIADLADTTARRHQRLAGANQHGAAGADSSMGRCDFQLQEDLTSMQWLSALRAHFCYWRHEDVALFITRAVCGYDVVDGGKAGGAAAASD